MTKQLLSEYRYDCRFGLTGTSKNLTFFFLGAGQGVLLSRKTAHDDESAKE